MGKPGDIRLAFDDVAEIYDSVRPSYPADLFDALFTMLPTDPMVVEVGPGTGQATRDLLARGASVLAIEIGPSMAATLQRNVSSDRLRVSVGDFETETVSPASADAVFSATAYHWISKAAQTDRPAAILRPGGVVAIVDLIQVEANEDSGFFAAAQPVYARHGQAHVGAPAPARDAADPAIRHVLGADARFDSVRVRRYDWDQTYSASQYRQLMLSYSVTQMMDEPEQVRLLDDIESLVTQEFGGAVVRPLVVTLTTAVRR